MFRISKNFSSIAQLMRSIELNTPRSVFIARFLVPFCFGLYSLWLGADANWDLYNYHMYNAFAWLHDKHHIDLAPAGLQSYFNPLLDVFFYIANTHLPSRIVGFFLGVLHGLSFIFILTITQRALPTLAENNRYRVPLLLALAGCLSANFLSGLGNSMGDDSTALFSLAGVAILVSNWGLLGRWTARMAAIGVGAGIVVGLGVGFKLTNAVFALAISAALLFYPVQVIARFRLACLFGIGLLLGFAVTGGPWMLYLWKSFGNPLYPQFGALFPNPLVQPDVMGDPRWRPHGWFDTVFWPYIFSADSKRLGEIRIRQTIWPIVYTLFWIWVVMRTHAQIVRRKTTMTLDARAKFIVLFVALGYLAWMEVFSIFRYIVAVEMLAPLVVWILLQQLLPNRRGEFIAAALIAISSIVTITGGARTFGHEPWSDPVWHAQVPVIAEPERTTVVLATTTYTNAFAWLATKFPEKVAFAQIESSFPGTQAFTDQLPQVIQQRGGPTYAIFEGEFNGRVESVAKANRKAEYLGLPGSERGCEFMRWAVKRFHVRAVVAPLTSPDKHCEFVVRAEDVQKTDAKNQHYRDLAVQKFARNGFTLNPSTCELYAAGIGDGRRAYQWCQLSL